MPPRFSVIQRPFAILFPPHCCFLCFSLLPFTTPRIAIRLPICFFSPRTLYTSVFTDQRVFCGLIYFLFAGTLSHGFGTPTKHVGPCSPPFPPAVTQAVCVAGSFSILMLPLCVCASIHTINLQNCNAGRIEIVQKKKKIKTVEFFFSFQLFLIGKK